MNKREMLGAGGIAALVALAPPAWAKPASPTRSAGAPVLTLSGAVGRTNRGPMDPAVDLLAVKHQFRFVRAFEFGSGALAALDSVRIQPTLEFDGRAHRLQGPLLATVLEAAGVRLSAVRELTLHAVDGYTVPLSLDDAQAWQMMLALKIDGRPLALGGLGPQWAVVDADRLPDFKERPLGERFAACPWGLYHIEIA